MNGFIQVTAWITALIPFAAPPVLLVLLAVPRSRRRLLAPHRRRRAARLERSRVLAQARRDARTAILETEAFD